MKMSFWNKMKNNKIIFVIFFSCIILFCLFQVSNKKIIEKMEGAKINNKMKGDNKMVYIYAYYEKNDLYKKNFIHFLKNGGILDDIDYYIVINGKYTVDIPDLPNIQVINRENKGFDFGAYSHLINNLENMKDYDYYIFSNATIIGPYVKQSDKVWIDEFIDLFNSSTTTKVGIVGTSVCFISREQLPTNIFNDDESDRYFVQSQFFMLTSDYFHFLKKINFFNEQLMNETIFQNVLYEEIKMSTHALTNGWNINCYLNKYKDLDFVNLRQDINPTSFGGDSYYKNRYFGNTIDKYDVIFLKNKRFLQDEQR